MINKFFKYCKNNLPNSLSGKLSVFILIIWVLMAVFSPFIANNQPIIAKNSNGWLIPIFAKSEIQKKPQYSFKINPIIPYKFNNLDLEHSFQPPLSAGNNGMHFLGTDKLGRDIAAGMVNGARVAFIVATTAILLSSIFGIFIGLVIGFYGDSGIKKNLLQQAFILGLSVVLIYYLTHLIKYGFSFYTISPIIILVILAYYIDISLKILPIKKYGLPIDIIVQRLFEIKESVPGLFIILAIVTIVAKTSLFTIPLILAFLFWMTFARHARAEALQIREEAYILSAKASGMSDFRIMVHHILPNALPSLLVVVAFAFSGVILLESTLSFLGIGIPLEEMSWGKILAEAKKSPKSWWLAIFPGMAIFLVLFSFNTLGDILANYQRKLK